MRKEKEHAFQSMKSNDMVLLTDENKEGLCIPVFHYHNVYELYLLSEGERHLLINDQVYLTTGGDVALMKPYDFHRSYGDTPYSGICINFSEQYLDRYFTPLTKKGLLSCYDTPVVSLGTDKTKHFMELCHQIKEHPTSKQLYLAEILDLISEASKLNFRPQITFDSKENPISKYIDEHLMTIQGLEEIADAFYITKNYLCYLFKSQTGMTIMSYINSQRVKQAAFFLGQPGDSIVGISRKCGFESATYFNRIFKRYMGCTPSEFRSHSF